MTLKRSAQVSLEYLLLLLAMLCVFAVFFGASNALFQAGLFAVDAKNAAIFSDELEKNISFLSFLSDGSSLKLEAAPLAEWKLLFDGDQLYVVVDSNVLGESKSFSFSPSLSPKISFDSILGRKDIFLEKSGEFVLIKNS